MNKSQKNDDWKTPSDAHNIKDSVQRTGILKFINRLHTKSTIYIVAGVGQLIFGLAIITAAILGFIRPLWLATLFTALSSLSAMVGFFLVYHTVSEMHNQDQLLRDAMKRVMESKN